MNEFVITRLEERLHRLT